MNGLLLIDKPAGMTSHDVVRRVRRIFATSKVGHAGTLDPMATGVLVVAVGEGTKILQCLVADDKRYQASVRLGVVTDTLDAEGAIVSEAEVPLLEISQIEEVCDGFRGTIEQVPPMYSALKRDGVPLYKLARQGREIERQARQVTIAELRIVGFQLPDLTIDVTCSKGTYIRTLAADIGASVGCGAHLTALRRLRSGHFTIDSCCCLEDLAASEDPASFLIPLMDALSDWPAVAVDDAGCRSLSFGIPPQQEQCTMDRSLAEGEQVRLHHRGHLLALATFRSQRLKEKRGDFELIRVFHRGADGD